MGKTRRPEPGQIPQQFAGNSGKEFYQERRYNRQCLAWGRAQRMRMANQCLAIARKAEKRGYTTLARYWDTKGRLLAENEWLDGPPAARLFSRRRHGDAFCTAQNTRAAQAPRLNRGEAGGAPV